MPGTKAVFGVSGIPGRAMRMFALAAAMSIYIFVSSMCGIGVLEIAHADGADASSNRHNVVFVMDASNSMNSTDPQGLRFEAVGQFADLLTETGNKLGGVVFSNGVSGSHKLIAADNQKKKKEVVKALKAVKATGYTNIGDGLHTAVSMLKNEGDEDLESVIVFVSDGSTEMPTKEQLEESLEKKADALQQAHKAGIKIYSVCLNANKSADIKEMKQLSSATGGVFQEVSSAADLNKAVNAFYGLVNDIDIPDPTTSKIPSNGKLRTPIKVPNWGVEEVNIIINGNAKKAKLYRPDGSREKVKSVSSKTYKLLKVTDVVGGTWELVTYGVPGDSIKITLVYNNNLGIKVSAKPAEDKINPADPLVVSAWLKQGKRVADKSEYYKGYSAKLHIKDKYGKEVDSVSMKLNGDHFEVSKKLKEGVWSYSVSVKGNQLKKSSKAYGPIKVTDKALTEAERNNTPPRPANGDVEEDTYIWPFVDANYTYDMNQLAVDDQDSELHYEIVSSTLVEGDDYDLDGNTLQIHNFSLSKAEFEVQATDSGGLSCDVNLLVKSHNIGIMTLVFLGIVALIALIVFGVLLYILLTRPSRGDVAVQSYCDGVYAGSMQGRSWRGRCKLSGFGIDQIGIDYRKSYFQATGNSYIELHTNVPVNYAGQQTRQVKINSGSPVTVCAPNDSNKQLRITFTSRIPAGRASGGRPKIKQPKIKQPKRPKRPRQPKAPRGSVRK